MAAKVGVARKGPSNGAIISAVAGDTGLTRKQVAAVFDSLVNQIHRTLAKKHSGPFTLLGLLRIKVAHKAGTQPRKGVHPFTGQEQNFRGKPARTVVKLRALKTLRRMAD